jgi:hypothetical protein
MPTFAGIVLGGLAGWLTSESLRERVSTRIAAGVSLVVWLLVFAAARALLARLRRDLAD